MGLVKQGNQTAERYVLPPEEVARWRKVAGEPIWQDWGQEDGEQGQARGEGDPRGQLSSF